MGKNTKIEWTDHTFNPWRGCTKVHSGCANCYAERQSKRNPNTLGIWGDHGKRVVAAEGYWGAPVQWNREAEREGRRRRVFCASLADVFEDWPHQLQCPNGNWAVHHREWGRETHFGCVPLKGGNDALHLDGVRRRLFRLIDATPHLDWLLLTKRPENVLRMWPRIDCELCAENRCGFYRANLAAGGNAEVYRDNVWIGTSVSDQETSDKYMPELLKCRDLVPVLFLSCEPLLGPIDLTRIEAPPEQQMSPNVGLTASCLHAVHEDRFYRFDAKVDWVIVGGESGPKARPCHAKWVRSLVRQCESAGVPSFVKQLGARCEITDEDSCAWPHDSDHWGRYDKSQDRWWATFKDPKGGDPAEWPDDLRVRQ